jgi:hypothetical protein
VYDQGDHDSREVVCRLDFEVLEASRDALFEFQLCKETLEDNQPSEGGQFLVFKSQIGNNVSLALHSFSGSLHGGDLLGVCGFSESTFYLVADRLSAILAKKPEKAPYLEKFGNFTQSELKEWVSFPDKRKASRTYARTSGFLMQR